MQEVVRTLLTVGALTSIRSKTAGTVVDLCLNASPQVKSLLLMHDRLTVQWTFAGWDMMQRSVNQWPAYAQQGFNVMQTLMCVAQRSYRNQHDTSVNQGLHQDVQALCLCLPPEMWFHVFSMLTIVDLMSFAAKERFQPSFASKKPPTARPFCSKTFRRSHSHFCLCGVVSVARRALPCAYRKTIENVVQPDEVVRNDGFAGAEHAQRLCPRPPQPTTHHGWGICCPGRPGGCRH